MVIAKERIVLKLRAVLRIIIQNAQMSCRVQKAHRVVLTVDIDKSSAQLPQNRSRCRVGHVMGEKIACAVERATEEGLPVIDRKSTRLNSSHRT